MAESRVCSGGAETGRRTWSIPVQGIVINLTAVMFPFLAYPAYALLASGLISRLNTGTTNRVVGMTHVAAATVLASLQR